jgi:hypothetical protein
VGEIIWISYRDYLTHANPISPYIKDSFSAILSKRALSWACLNCSSYSLLLILSAFSSFWLYEFVILSYICFNSSLYFLFKLYNLSSKSPYWLDLILKISSLSVFIIAISSLTLSRLYSILYIFLSISDS